MLSIRPARRAAAFVKSVNTALDKLRDKKLYCLALITQPTFFKWKPHGRRSHQLKASLRVTARLKEREND